MKKITKDEYEEVQKFYKKMKFKNLKEYLECYLKIRYNIISRYI